MIKNYFSIILRTVLRDKLGHFLNVSGLAIAIAAFSFIFYYVSFELSYDKFHSNADQIYRVTLSQYLDGQLNFNSAENYPGVGPAMKEQFPEVKNYTRLYNIGAKNNVLLFEENTKEEGFKMDKILYADSSFFEVFSFPLLAGEKQTCLNRPYTAVVSASFAKKMFKDADPLGKNFSMSDDDFSSETFTVTGIFDDIPFHSHLKFDVLLSYYTLYNRGANAMDRAHLTWKKKDMYTYILTDKGVNPTELSAKLPELVKQHNPDLEIFNQEDQLSLQALSTIHLESNLADEPEQNGNRKTILILALAGILTLIIAMVNFLNYTIAKSMTKAKDFGLRKIFGARKSDLFGQFIFNASIFSLLAIIEAVGIIFLCFSGFKNFTNLLDLDVYSFLLDSSLLFSFLVVIIVGVLFGGIIPAIILSRFNLTTVVKGRILGYGKGLLLRRGLTTFQIFASTTLAMMSYIILCQINYLHSFELGINVADTYVLNRPGGGFKDGLDRKTTFDLFKEELAGQPGILSVTGSSMVPGKKIRMNTSIRNFGESIKNSHQVDLAAVDDGFLQTLDFRLVSGRSFSKDMQTDDDTAVVVTTETTKILGYNDPEEAIGKTITVSDLRWNPIIIGVVNDYHHLSPRESTTPTIFAFNNFVSEYYLIRVNPNQTSETLSQIKGTWDKVFPGNPFQYFYLQDFFNQQYATEQVFSKYILIFAIIAILISCLGLFNISLFTMIQRTREIGIRKTLGASASQIGWLLLKDYLKLIALGSLIAIPTAFLFGQRWLEDYAYSISLGEWSLGLPILIILGVSVITIGFYTRKASYIDPVKAIQNNT